jgi:hypothetical protein
MRTHAPSLQYPTFDSSNNRILYTQLPVMLVGHRFILLWNSARLFELGYSVGDFHAKTRHSVLSTQLWHPGVTNVFTFPFDTQQDFSRKILC